MDPRQHYADIVEPNFREFAEHFDSLRHAFNLAAATDALAAHIYWWCVENKPHEVVGVRDDSAYRDKLAEADSSFALLRDVAKAHKHVKLTRGTPMVKSSEQSSAKGVGFGLRGYSEGRFNGVVQISIETEIGERPYFETIIRNAIRFLLAEMKRVGVPA